MATELPIEGLPPGDPSRPHCMVPIEQVDPACLVQIDGKVRYQQKEPKDDPRNSYWAIRRAYSVKFGEISASQTNP